MGWLSPLIALVSATLGSWSSPDTGRVRYDDLQVVRVFTPNARVAEEIRSLARDVWSEHGTPGVVDVVLDAQGRAALGVTGLDHRVLVSDLQGLADDERARLDALTGPGAPPLPFLTDFRDYAAVMDHLDTLAADHPGEAATFEVGTTLENRAIRGIRVGPDDGRPEILVSGTQHAREWISVMTVTCIADRLLNTAAVDPVVAAALEEVAFEIVPIVNPDGYVYSWETDRFWRKNRNGTGVDLNRNWSVEWGGDGASPDPDHWSYHGAGPFSELETASLSAHIEAMNNLVAHIDFHAYGQIVLYPWGYTIDPAPDDAALLGLATEVAANMTAAHDDIYDPLQAAAWYPHAGNMPDWIYQERQAWSFTVELRPTEQPAEGFNQGFVLPPEEIEPTCDEAMAGLLTLVGPATEPDPGPGTAGGSTGGGSSGGGTSSTGGLSGSGSSDTGSTGGLGETSTSSTSGGESSGSSAGTGSSGGVPPLTGGGKDPGPTGGVDSDGDTGTGGAIAWRDGCACRTPTRTPPAALWLPLLVVGLTRRRGRP